MSVFEILALIGIAVITVCCVVGAGCILCLYLRLKGVDLKSVEMDVYALWAAKRNDDYRVPRTRR